MRAENVLGLIGNTPLVRLRSFESHGTKLYAKLEGQNPTGSVKDRIALAMIEAARDVGDRVLLEPSSGNTGIALALVARLKALRLTVVMPESVSQERREMLALYGAELRLSPGDEGTNGAIRIAKEMAEDAKYLMLNQYENQANPAAHYETTAKEIIDELPGIDMFVAGLGTGGTLTGAGRRLKEHNPAVTIVASEPPAGEAVQGLRSLEDGYIPPILDQSVIDRKYMVGSLEAFAATKKLFENEGIFAGISSGAALHAAMRAVDAIKPSTAVVLLADGGWKYLSTAVHSEEPEKVAEKMKRQIWW